MYRLVTNFLCSTLKKLAKLMKAAPSEPYPFRQINLATQVLAALIGVMILVTCFSAHAANLTVNGAQTFQTIDGMGVNINVNSWNNGQLKPALDFLVTTNGSTLYRVIRDPIDWVDSESLIPDLHALKPSTLQQVYETAKMQDIWNTIGYLNQKGIGGRQIILNFMGWTPTWLGGSGSYGVASYITAGKEQEFATMVASLVYYGKKVKGLDFTYLSPTNEEDWNCLEGPCVAPVQYTTIMHDIADELNFMGITDVRFVVPDTANSSSSFISQSMADSTVAGLTDHFGIHYYSGSPVSPGPSYTGKNYWLTETSQWCSACDAGGSGPPNEWSFATQTTDAILGDINNGFSAALIWEAYDNFWYHHNAFSLWGLLAYDQTTGIYTPRTRAFAYTHFNYFIRPGDVVIQSSDSINGVPTTVAVYNATTGKIAIIGRNSGNSAITIDGQLANLPVVNSLALYETSSSVTLARGSDVPVAGGLFTLQIPANTIFTLTNRPITFDLVPPSVAITSPLGGASVSGTIEVTAIASDNNTVAGVQFVLDGASFGQEITSLPYSISIDTTTLAKGGHTLTAIARDPAGNEALSQQILLMVNNGGGSLPSIYLVQNATNITTSARTLSATLPSPVTAGNLIAVSVSGWPNLPAAAPVTDSRGNTYSIAGTVLVSQGAYSAIYYARNVTGGTDTVTVSTVSSGGQISMAVAEFSGVDTVSPLGKTSGSIGSGTTPSSGTMTPGMTGELIIGSGTHNGNTVTAVGPGFTKIAIPTEDSNTHQPLAMEYQILSGTTPTTATFSLANGYPWTQNGVLFKPTVQQGSDITPPVVAISAPLNDANVSGMVAVSSTATDNIGVTRVEFYLDGLLQASDSTTPYQWSWNSLQSANGSHSLAAIAYDAAGNTGQSGNITVTVSNGTAGVVVNPTTVSVAEGGATATYTVVLTSQPTASVTITVTPNSQLTVNKTALTFTTSNWKVAQSVTVTAVNDAVAEGAHTGTITHKASGGGYDAVVISNVMANITDYDTAAPTASITAPASNATVTGTVTVTVDASDNVGVSRVEFYLDGSLLATDTTVPYSFNWNTATVANGLHTLTARAYDAIGNTGTSTGVVVTVANQLPSILLVQKATNITTSARTLSATLPSPVTAGNLIVVSVSGWPNLPAATPVTDSRGNSYSIAGTVLVSQGAYSAIYYARNVTGGTDTVTVSTVSSGGQITMAVAEFSGVDTVSPLDKTSGSIGSGTTPSSGTMTPSMTGELIVGSGTHNGNTVTAAGTGFTLIAIPTEDSNTHQPLAMEYQVLSGTTPTTATFSLANGYPWTQNGVLFKHR